MRHETTPPALTFFSTTIFSAIVLLAGVSIIAPGSVRTIAQPLQASRALSSTPQRKRIVALRQSNTPDGSRLTVTSDSTLNDFSSYVEGERFFVLIPQATLTGAQQNGQGRGFADLRFEQRGDDVVLSFILQNGATVSFNQNFNRLDVVFITNEQANKADMQQQRRP